MNIFEKWKQGFQWTKFQDGIGNPPWDYYFLQNLDEKEYPKYLAKLFYLNTGEKLPLLKEWNFKSREWSYKINKKKCKTFNQKIQWLKLYDATPLKSMCTDKVVVRDYVREKIGEEYLKSVLQIIPENKAGKCTVIARNNDISSDEAIQKEVKQQTVDENLGNRQSKSRLDCRADIKMSSSARNDRELDDVTTYFDKIDFDKLPNSFVIKCNHGCKWQYIIKNKNEFLNTKPLFELVKRNITGWLEQDFSFWGGFEMQYRTSRRVLCREKGNQMLRFLRGKPNSTLRVRTRLSEFI